MAWSDLLNNEIITTQNIRWFKTDFPVKGGKYLFPENFGNPFQVILFGSIAGAYGANISFLTSLLNYDNTQMYSCIQTIPISDQLINFSVFPVAENGTIVGFSTNITISVSGYNKITSILCIYE